MQNLKPFLILSFMAFSLFGRAQKVDNTAYDLMLSGLLSHSVEEISVEEVAVSDNILFVDAREKNEYKVSHLKDAVWVGYDRLNLKPLKEVNKNKEVIVYCSVGYRSEKVAEKLKAQGFTNVKNLYGGIFEWVNKGNTVYNMDGDSTKKIHAYNKVWGIWLSAGEKVYD